MTLLLTLYEAKLSEHLGNQLGLTLDCNIQHSELAIIDPTLQNSMLVTKFYSF
jgi:hypothetical protein